MSESLTAMTKGDPSLVRVAAKGSSDPRSTSSQVTAAPEREAKEELGIQQPVVSSFREPQHQRLPNSQLSSSPSARPARHPLARLISSLPASSSSYSASSCSPVSHSQFHSGSPRGSRADSQTPHCPPERTPSTRRAEATVRQGRRGSLLRAFERSLWPGRDLFGRGWSGRKE